MKTCLKSFTKKPSLLELLVSKNLLIGSISCYENVRASDASFAWEKKIKITEFPQSFAVVESAWKFNSFTFILASLSHLNCIRIITAWSANCKVNAKRKVSTRIASFEWKGWTNRKENWAESVSTLKNRFKFLQEKRKFLLLWFICGPQLRNLFLT